MERSVFGAELRAEGEMPLIAGYAAVWNSLSVVLYGVFREKIAPGAFTETLGQDDIRSLWNHNADMVLGRNRNGTLRLREDAYGLAIECDVPDTQAGRDAVVSIGRKDVDQMSFMFDALVDDWSEDTDGMIVRTLYKNKLYEVSPVTFPAYPSTSVMVRSNDEKIISEAADWVALKLRGLSMPGWVQARLAGNVAELRRVPLAMRRRELDVLERI